MYVEDVEDGKRTYTHILAQYLMDFQSEKSFGKLRLRLIFDIFNMLQHI